MPGETRLLAAHDFGFFASGRGVDLLDVGVGHLLDIVQGAALFVLADEFVLQQLLQVLVGVAADLSDDVASFLRLFVDVLGQLLAPIVGEFGTGFVSQESFLFNGTIRENLLFAKSDASEAEIWNALRAANADGNGWRRSNVRSFPEAGERKRS